MVEVEGNMHENGHVFALVKVAPILCLLYAVACQLQRSKAKKDKGACTSFATYIFVGLFFSAIGDVCLVWEDDPDMFMKGMAAFAIAHVCYMCAFGFFPLSVHLLLPFAILSSYIYTHLHPGIEEQLKIPVMAYVAVIACMGWRALVQIVSGTGGSEDKSMSPEVAHRRRMRTIIGAVIFMISDVSLATAKFVTPYANSEKVVMSTYYLGQMFLAAATIDTPPMKHRAPEKVKGSSASAAAGDAGRTSRRRKMS
eukprot:Nk52_evm3s147 gene=Nk52_evmTU3s147